MKVFVGLSGGVDSAVSAHLLKKAGHEVTGVFIKGWEPDFLPCTGAEDRLSAMRVAAHLGIPFKTYDLSEEYKQSVVDYFVSEYKAGRTPNPDVVCNRTIKFGALWRRAQADGAEYIATGHYADTNGVVLRTSKDPSKDQTYFLWTLTKADLAHSLFPLGRMVKREVRSIAEKIKLPNAIRPDSQGLCFLGHVDMKAFLMRYIKPVQGPLVNERGNILGEHDGAWYYTLGQHIDTPLGVRSYVVGKDVTTNTLVVSENPHGTQAESDTVMLVRESWVSGVAPRGTVLVQYRYHGPLIRAVVDGEMLRLEESVFAAKGQSVVVYDQTGVLCYGGATIG